MCPAEVISINNNEYIIAVQGTVGRYLADYQECEIISNTLLAFSQKKFDDFYNFCVTYHIATHEELMNNAVKWYIINRS